MQENVKSSVEVNIFGAMSLCEEYFPTKAYTNAVNRLGSLLSKERDRLDDLARALGRKYAVSPDNLAEQVPGIVGFAKEYHRAYSLYLEAVLPQHKNGIQCGPACGNCCHHYPMSVEPFELVYLYTELRKRDDFMSVMEDCQIRATLFESLLEKIPKTKLKMGPCTTIFRSGKPVRFLHLKVIAGYIPCVLCRAVCILAKPIRSFAYQNTCRRQRTKALWCICRTISKRPFVAFRNTMRGFLYRKVILAGFCP